MGQHKVFRLKDRETGPTFVLEGTKLDSADNATEHKEEFQCIWPASATSLVEYIEATQSGIGALTELKTFIASVLIAGDAERFLGLLDAKDFVIDIETLGAIGEWLLEVYSNHPTEQPSPSGPGPETTTPTSTDDSPLSALT